MIELSLVGVRVELPSNQPIVLLKEAEGDRYLPIWIGAVEATAIAFALQGIETPRPMTHDLMKDILSEVNVGVDRILVSELVDQTFYATIRMTANGQTSEVSSRPSDAIAIAVRLGTPIFASENVLDEAGHAPTEEAAPEAEELVDEFREFIEKVNPEDFAS